MYRMFSYMCVYGITINILLFLFHKSCVVSSLFNRLFAPRDSTIYYHVYRWCFIVFIVVHFKINFFYTYTHRQSHHSSIMNIHVVQQLYNDLFYKIFPFYPWIFYSLSTFLLLFLAIPSAPDPHIPIFKPWCGWIYIVCVCVL